MRKHWVILSLLIVMLGILPAQAQEDDVLKVWSPIDVVTANYMVTDDGDITTLELHIEGTHGDACEFDLMTAMSIYDNNIDVQLYREIPIAATCLREDTPFETDILIDMALDEIPPYVTVNDQVWQMIMPDDVMSEDISLQLEEQMLAGAMIDAVMMPLVNPTDDEADAYYALTMLGSYGVGCDLPIVASVRELTDTTVVGIYTPIAEDVVCPAILVSLNETVRVPAALLDEATVIAVNDYMIVNELETQTMRDNKVMTHIQSVSIDVVDGKISLDVSGEHPDGCNFPVQVDQSRDGNTVTVEIYRNVPADVMCPMVLSPYSATIQLDGLFESGSYDIRVNDVTESAEF